MANPLSGLISADAALWTAGLCFAWLASTFPVFVYRIVRAGGGRALWLAALAVAASTIMPLVLSVVYENAARNDARFSTPQTVEGRIVGFDRPATSKSRPLTLDVEVETAAPPVQIRL
jgi:hypothetical protein